MEARLIQETVKMLPVSERSQVEPEFIQWRSRVVPSRSENPRFDTRLENLMARAAGVVAMGGYNTFCEILSFDKPALIVPRTAPRLEQYIRAQRAAELGLVAVLSENGDHDPRTMAAALLQLMQQPRPSAVVIPGLLDGMASVNRLARKWLGARRAARWRPGARRNA